MRLGGTHHLDADADAGDVQWMQLAIAQAEAARAAGEVPVGAVLVKQGVLIATGRNASVEGHDPSAHAEINALRAGARALGNYRLDGCTLFVTLEPCAMCAGAALHARLDRLVFGAADRKTGAAGSVLNLFAEPRLNHQTRLQGGVLAAACGELLRTFFAERRALARERAEPLRDDALRTPAARFAALAKPFDDAASVSHWLSDLPSLAGWRLHYLDQGPADASWCCVALHGPGQWGYLYRHLVAAVEAVEAVNGERSVDLDSPACDQACVAAAGAGRASPAWRLLIPDLIGHGRSDKPKRGASHTLAWHAGVLLEWIERLKLPKLVLIHAEASRALASQLVALAPERFAGVLSFEAARHQTPEATAARATPQQRAPSAALELAAIAQAWRAPFPDRGFEAALRALAGGPVSDGPSPTQARQLLATAMGYFPP